MAQDCVFCQIIRRELPAHVVAEDEHTIAFLDIHPLARGHTLVVPKFHARLLEELPTREGQSLFATAHALTPRVQRAVQAGASSLILSNGPEAGQDVPHIHMHIIPRFPRDQLLSVRPSTSSLGPTELARIAEAIRSM